MSRLLHDSTSLFYWVFKTKLWHHQNKLQLNKQVEKTELIASFSQGYLEEFRDWQNKTHTATRPNSDAQVSWQKPRSCRYKINYDGAVFHNSAKAGIRVVVRDHNGTNIATLSQKVRFHRSHGGETCSLLCSWVGTLWGWVWRWLGYYYRSPQGDLTWLLLMMPGHLQSNLSHHSFLHVKRNGNAVPHALVWRAQHCIELIV